MKSPEPNGKSSIHESDDTLHLVQAKAAQVTESEAADVIYHGDPCYLGLHFSRHHLQEDICGGIKVLKTDFVRVPVS